eukprot:TRINITY_DN68393_c0_g1_i1.p1 TRINITY_DN68393_c0_g1~~TRINITY_DN68393_c0_g1_i1.p1  ORF type:complete len:229 (-),score=59.93 TRINITY_DN68393_c0_g1_i1:88-774(-)
MVIIGQFSKPEEAQEQGLVYSTRVETLQLFKKIFSDWEPWWQAAPLNFSSNIAGGAASIPGLLVALKLRRLLPGLTRAKSNWVPIPLSVLVPGSLAGMYHEFLITNDILLQETACPVCVETRAIAGQVALGAGLSSLSAYAGSLIIGDLAKMKWSPRSFGGLVKLTKDVVSQGSMFLVTLIVAQMIIAGVLVQLQRSSHESVMEELERRIEVEEREPIDERVLGLQRE